MVYPKSLSDLFLEVEKESLYGKLILQLNKDFTYAHVEKQFCVTITPENLKQELHECVFKLINESFADYLNLLYIIDVPENAVKQLDVSDALKFSEAITFLILKREWQKVWYKNKL